MQLTVCQQLAKAGIAVSQYIFESKYCYIRIIFPHSYTILNMTANTVWRLLSGKIRPSCRVIFQRNNLSTSVHQDTLLDALERKKRSHKSKEFDTLGTWDTRLNVQIDESATLRTGHIVPHIDVTMIGHASVQGRRTYQEDRYCVKQLRPDLLYIAVFDGHGGDICAQYCQDHLERHILHHLDREDDLDIVLDKSFFDTNRSFERWYHSKKENLGRAVSSGSTATVALIQDNHSLYIGHCGDSRAILCRDNTARTLTKDHCPSDPEEAKRIKEAGGSVITDSIGRIMVNARLCMSRSIGDLELKQCGVTADPDIKKMTIKHGKDQFLVLTSDGINWVMQDQEIVDTINKCEDAREAAARLVDHALLYCTEDNATAIIVPFGSWGKGEGTSGMFYSFGRQMSNSSRFG